VSSIFVLRKKLRKLALPTPLRATIVLDNEYGNNYFLVTGLAGGFLSGFLVGRQASPQEYFHFHSRYPLLENQVAPAALLAL
jgi:hypothetical protein